MFGGHRGRRTVAQEQARGATLHAQQICVSADVAERDADRARKLHRDGLLPDDQLDRAISNARTLRAACNAAGADTQQAEAGVQVTRANLTRTVLRAPFDGVVAKLNGEIGEFTMPSPPGRLCSLVGRPAMGVCAGPTWHGSRPGVD